VIPNTGYFFLIESLKTGMDCNASEILSLCKTSHIFIAAGIAKFSTIVKLFLALAISKAISKEALRYLSFK